MTKSKKAIIGVSSALVVVMCAVMCVIMITQRQSNNAQNKDVLLTELQVGRYYLQDGTDDEYIEVYSDQTMCLFGYTLPNDAAGVRRESLKNFTARRYYALSDMGKHIGLGDTLTPENWKNTGYGYSDENTLLFSTPEGMLNYIYRAE